jgi:hypothetical protein
MTVGATMCRLGKASRAAGGMIVALALTACTATPTAPPASPDPPPDHRKIIADNLKTLFSPDAQVRNVMVSELMQVPSSAGQVWGTCVRVSATGSSGRPTLPRTYVFTFRRNEVAERRPAEGSDCAGAKLERLGG